MGKLLVHGLWFRLSLMAMGTRRLQVRTDDAVADVYIYTALLSKLDCRTLSRNH